MIKSLMVVGLKSGGVLFERYFGADLRTAEAQGEWLAQVRNATAPEWALLVNDGPEQVAAFGEVTIVYKLIQDVVVFLAGTDEHDALMLLDVARMFETCLRKGCGLGAGTAKNKRSAIRAILTHYPTLCLIVDEMIDDGEIDHADPAIILKLVKLQPTT